MKRNRLELNIRLRKNKKQKTIARNSNTDTFYSCTNSTDDFTRRFPSRKTQSPKITIQYCIRHEIKISTVCYSQQVQCFVYKTQLNRLFFFFNIKYFPLTRLKSIRFQNGYRQKSRFRTDAFHVNFVRCSDVTHSTRAPLTTLAGGNAELTSFGSRLKNLRENIVRYICFMCLAVLRRYYKYSRGEFIKLSDFTLLAGNSNPGVYSRNSTPKFNHKFARCWRAEFCVFSRDLIRKLRDENETIKRRVARLCRLPIRENSRAIR